METSLEDLETSSILAWITLNKFVNEGLKPIEFDNHRFLIEYLADDAPVKVTKKAAQVGLTVAETLDNFYKNKFRGMNVIHTLQTKDVIKGFVFPKVNPIIANNEAIRKIVSIDSEGLKQVGNFFTYYRGANAESQAINISADVLKIDELDRSNPQVVAMYPSRLDASLYRWKRYFSNPSAVGFGVDALYTESNQFHWFIKCSHCGHNWYIDYDKSTDPADANHYVDVKNEMYACGKCDKEIYDDDRRNGEWVAKYPQREVHGYWFSQLMAPWKPAKEIIQKHNDEPIDVFYNMTLGKAYTPSDMVVDRLAILRATSPSNIQRSNVSIGVDQDAGGQYYVAMTPDGVFDHGYVDSWDKIEHLKLMYNAVVVCDPNPYGATPKQMAAKYNDWYLCYFRETKGVDNVIEFKGQTVYADRTRVIDIVANEIVDARLLFRQRPSELEDTMIKHWTNLYRTTEEKEDGRQKSTWLKKEGKQSDYPFALTYARIGLTRMMGGQSDLVEPSYSEEARTTIHTVNKDGSINTDLSGLYKETMSQFDE